MVAATTKSVEDLDSADAYALVEAADKAVRAIESIRSRLGAKRDATAATGHVLEAILQLDGAIGEYDRPKIWAMRHALGGEGHTFASPHSATALLLGMIVNGLRPAASPEEEARHDTAKREIDAIANILKRCEHFIEANRAIDQWDAGNVVARAAADRAAHEERLARVPATAPAPRAQAPRPAPADSRPGPARAPSEGPAGDYVLEGTADAPGGNPFPTEPVG